MESFFAVMWMIFTSVSVAMATGFLAVLTVYEDLDFSAYFCVLQACLYLSSFPQVVTPPLVHCLTRVLSSAIWVLLVPTQDPTEQCAITYILAVHFLTFLVRWCMEVDNTFDPSQRIVRCNAKSYSSTVLPIGVPIHELAG